MKKLAVGLCAGVVLCMCCVSISHALTPQEIGKLIGIRTQMYGGMLLMNAVPGMIFNQDPTDMSVKNVNGSAQPAFELNAKNQVTITWKIADKNAAAFAAAIGLPPAMKLAKVTAPKHKKPQYAMMLTSYTVSGLSTGNKAEWKTFVTVGSDPTPRVLVFDKQSSAAGIDPVDVFSIPAGPVNVSMADGLASVVIATDQSYLVAQAPQYPRKSAVLSKDIINAADTVYSLKGTPVKYFYNATVGAGAIELLENDAAVITGSFPWLQYAQTVESIFLPRDSQMVAVPLASRYMPVTGAMEAAYAQFVLSIFGSLQSPQPILPEQAFPMLMQQFGFNPTLVFGLMDFYNALSVMQGGVPVVAFNIADNPKPLFINYRIDPAKAAAFESAYLPAGYHLAQVKLVDEQPSAEYTMSLNIYKLAGNSQTVSGYRAEWSTYTVNNGDPIPRFTIIKAITSTAGLDPVHALANYDPANIVSALTPPGIVSYSSDNNMLRIAVGTLDSRCMSDSSYCQMQQLVAYAAVQVPASPVVATPRKDWIETNDIMHWGNGVADLGFYDSTVNDARLLMFNVQPGDVLVDPTFAAFVDPAPMNILLFDGPENFALKAWGNLEQLMAEAAAGN